MRISELAESAGVPTSTVRYYERIGMLPSPARTPSGYRDFDDRAAARLLFITRARRMGLSCEQIGTLLSAWSGSNCSAAHDRVVRMVRDKRTEIARRISELEQLDAELAEIGVDLASSTPPPACRADLTCCVPESTGVAAVPLELGRRAT